MAQVGPYPIVEEIARGGMGVVFRAIDPDAGREVAVKVLLAKGRAPKLQRQRFAREARVLAKLNHRNIVRVHTIGEQDGCPYLVMDLVEGESLGELLERDGPLAIKSATQIATKLASALEHAHELGILHRDVKPDNVLIAEGEPRLTDFGLAKDLDSDERLTQTGRFMGTPGYWAPEQARGEREIGEGADVFGLGATLYALLTGDPPIRGTTLVEIMSRMREPATPPSQVRAEVDASLEAIVLRCLEPEPRERYPSARALREDLERYDRGDAVSARTSTAAGRAWQAARRRVPFLPWALGGLALAALAAGLALGFRPQSPVAPAVPSPPLAAASAPPSSARNVEEVRRLMGRRDYAGALAALSKVPSPSGPLVVKLTTRFVRAALRSGDLGQASRLLEAAWVQEALRASGPELRSQRLAAANDVVDHACALHPNTLLSPSLGVLEQLRAHARLALCVLTPGDSVDEARVDPLLSIFEARLSFSKEGDLVLAEFIDYLCLLAPHPALLTNVAGVAMRSLDKRVKRRLLPVLRRIAKQLPSPKHRYTLVRLLLSCGEWEEGLRKGRALLDAKALGPTEAAEVYQAFAEGFRLRGQPHRAVEASVAALDLVPADFSRRLALSRLYHDAGQAKEALREVRRVLRSIAWETSKRFLDGYRHFREAVECLWAIGGSRLAPELMRDLLRRLLREPKDTSLIELWQLRLAVVELKIGERETGLAHLEELAPLLARAQLSAEARAVGKARGKESARLIRGLLVPFEVWLKSR